MRKVSRIVLIGFMGVGKSSVAVSLSTLLNCPNIELDEEIVSMSGYNTVADIFANRGEPYFRQLELEAAQKLNQPLQVNQSSILVVSTGGGVVMSKDTMAALLNPESLCVHLTAPISTIQLRLEGDCSRPNYNPVTAAKRLAARIPLYEQYAQITFDTTMGPAEIIAKQLLDAVSDYSLASLDCS